jgi:hypothetical protein
MTLLPKLGFCAERGWYFAAATCGNSAISSPIACLGGCCVPWWEVLFGETSSYFSQDFDLNPGTTEHTPSGDRSGSKLVVSMAGEACDARARGPNSR